MHQLFVSTAPPPTGMGRDNNFHQSPGISLICNSLFGGIWGEAELISGILFGEHRRNTFRELRNLFHEFGEINALFLGSKGA